MGSSAGEGGGAGGTVGSAVPGGEVCPQPKLDCISLASSLFLVNSSSLGGKAQGMLFKYRSFQKLKKRVPPNSQSLKISEDILSDPSTHPDSCHLAKMRHTLLYFNCESVLLSENSTVSPGPNVTGPHPNQPALCTLSPGQTGSQAFVGIPAVLWPVRP